MSRHFLSVTNQRDFFFFWLVVQVISFTFDFFWSFPFYFQKSDINVVGCLILAILFQACLLWLQQFSGDATAGYVKYDKILVITIKPSRVMKYSQFREKLDWTGHRSGKTGEFLPKKLEFFVVNIMCSRTYSPGL